MRRRSHKQHYINESNTSQGRNLYNINTAQNSDWTAYDAIHGK